MSRRFTLGKRRILGIPDDGWGILQIGVDERKPDYYTREPQYMGVLSVGGKLLALNGWRKTRKASDVILLRFVNHVPVHETKEKSREKRLLQWKEVRWDDEFEFPEDGQ